MNGLLYYPIANLFKYLFSLPVSPGVINAIWVPVLCFPLHYSVVTHGKGIRIASVCVCGGSV